MYGQFFHRFVGRVGKRDAVALEHALRIGDFAAAGVDFGISRVRAAFLADGLEAFRFLSLTPSSWLSEKLTASIRAS